MKIHQFISIGSYNNRTYVSDYSDRDFLIVIEDKDFYRGFDFIITQIKKNFDVIEGDIPAIKIMYANRNIDLIPCIYSSVINSKYGRLDSFLIHSENGYKKTCPLLCQNILNEIDIMYSYELRPFIIGVKLWKYTNQILISSFSIELLVIEYFFQTNTRTELDCISFLKKRMINKEETKNIIIHKLSLTHGEGKYLQ